MITNDRNHAFSFLMIVLAVAGVGLVVINTLSKVNPAFRKASLTRVLWKVDSSNAKSATINEQRRAWYKLFCAGVMMFAVLSSLMLRWTVPRTSIAIGSTGLLLWVTYLWYYWKAVVETADNITKSVHHSNEVLSNWAGRNKKNGEDSRLPVTVVTGFLGSGKTTFLRHLLNNTVGMKILVIENEIGDEGIDHELLMRHTKKEDVVLMNNGCICCTVRNDLLTTFRKMFTNDAFAQLDWVVIETTGLADPAPLIQSFYMDKECQQQMRVDGVITVVDGKFFPQHLVLRNSTGAHGGKSEALLQVSFADIILLNKIDLLSESEKREVHTALLQINPSVSIVECTNAAVDIELLLNMQAFDPNKLSTVDLFCFEPIRIHRESISSSSSTRSSKQSKSKKTSNSVATYSFISDNPLDLDKFNEWISKLLQLRGENIFRMKGILHMSGFEEMFVCHGVHMIFDGEMVAANNSTNKQSRIVFIGRGLDKDELKEGFESTVATIA